MGLWIRWTHIEIIALPLKENNFICLIHTITAIRDTHEKCPAVHLVNSPKFDASKRQKV